MKIKTIAIFVLIVAAFAAGLLLKEHFFEFYDSLNKQVAEMQKINIGSVISEVGKQMLTPPPLQVLGAEKQVDLLKSQIILQTNVQRHQNGSLPALIENKRLDEAASAKASDMFEKQYFEHISPLGLDPGKLVQNHGYEFIVAGENLILGNFSSEEEVVDDWMASSGHRANILNNRYTEIGVAIVKGTYQGQTVWMGVQEFGFPLSACPSPDNILKNTIDSDKQQLDFLYSELGTNKKQIDSLDQTSPTYSQMADDYNKLVAQYEALSSDTKKIISNYNNQVSIFNNCVSE